MILTGKPQTPIPWEAIATAKAACPTLEAMAERIGEIVAAHNEFNKTEEQKQLVADATYAGILTDSRYDVPGFTEKGRELVQEFARKQCAAAAQQTVTETAETETTEPKRQLALF